MRENRTRGGRQPVWLTAVCLAITTTGLATPLPRDPAAPLDVLVLLTEQADLTGVESLSDRADRAWHVHLTLQEQAERTQARLTRHGKAAGLTVRPFWVVNALHVTGPADRVAALADHPEVSRLIPNRPFRAAPLPPAADTPAPAPADLPWGLSRVRAPAAWAMGITGQGVVIAVIDTGVEGDHPALESRYRGFSEAGVDHAYNWWDAVGALVSGFGPNPCGLRVPHPCDDHGHGTHVTGTAVGAATPGQAVGVAPGAQWIGCRCMEAGHGTPAMYLECLQWVLAPTDAAGNNPDPSRAPHIVNNSWQCTPGEGCVDPDLLRPAFANLRAAGILVVNAVGNGGPACGTITLPPSTYPDALTVGAITNANDLAGFSSRGPVPGLPAHRFMPDLVAPGVGILSATRGGGYDLSSGTSMAAPHVAGLAALVIAATPELCVDVEWVENLIRNSALPSIDPAGCGGLPPGWIPNHAFGHGRADALGAVTGARCDLDRDGWVDASDSTRLAAWLAANRTALDCGPRCGDTDRNGVIDVVDLLRIRLRSQ